MKKIRSGYLLGIGSNINPPVNIAQIIALLLDNFSTISLSRILKIPPVGIINSSNDFLNTVIFAETNITERNLKNICNNIEIKLGRDHNDPIKKIKARTADLDILAITTFPNDKDRPAASMTDEYFLYPLINELFAFLSESAYPIRQPGVSINIENITFGQTATTIHRNASTGNKWIS